MVGPEHFSWGGTVCQGEIMGGGFPVGYEALRSFCRMVGIDPDERAVTGMVIRVKIGEPVVVEVSELVNPGAGDIEAKRYRLVELPEGSPSTSLACPSAFALSWWAGVTRADLELDVDRGHYDRIGLHVGVCASCRSRLCNLEVPR
jgi:hypothetical protein